MSHNSTVKTDISVNRDADYVWKWLFNPENLKRLVDFPLSADLTSTGGGGYSGTVTLGRTRFEAEVQPRRQLVLKSSDRAFALRVAPEGERCRVSMASSTPEGKGTVFTEECMNGVLRRLRSLTELSGSRSFSYDDAMSRYVSGDFSEEAPLPAGIAEGRSAARREERPAARRAGRGVIVLRRAAAALVAAAVVAGGAFAAWRFSRRSEEPPAVSFDDVSASVTLGNSLAIQPGQGRQEVEKLFGTAGVDCGDGSVIYRGAEIDGRSRPVVQVKVAYSGEAVERVTYLNLSSSEDVDTEPLAAVSAYYGMSVEEMQTAVGAPLSMMRRYSGGERGTVTEYHFGYVDPFANFSPSWRGEVVVTETSADEGCSTRKWVDSDGSDPLMIGSLEGEAAGFQYSSYDEFLNDKFSFDYSLLMLNRYSRGDLRAVFGELTEYEGGGAYDFYRVDSAETFASGGGELPVWRMSFGLDTRGVFKVGSYVNVRLAGREGQLEGCEPSKVALGMSYSEVREYMAVVPTAFGVDEGGYTMYYGKRTDGKPSAEEQFEFVLKFGLDNRVCGIYDNTGMNNQGSISTNDPLARTE